MLTYYPYGDNKGAGSTVYVSHIVLCLSCNSELRYALDQGKSLKVRLAALSLSNKVWGKSESAETR